MIDTTKLLPRSKGSSLSRDSVKNLSVIKRDVIEIDSLLKMRFVLSKVREGILKQKEERERRIERETLLEERKGRDNDDDFDIGDPMKPKPKPGRGGVIGALISSVLKNFGIVSLSKIGALLKVGKVLKLLLSPKVLIIAGTITILTKVIQNVSQIEKSVLKKDLDAVSGNKVKNGIDSFINALQFVTAAYAIGSAVNFGKRKLQERLIQQRGIAQTRVDLLQFAKRERAKTKRLLLQRGTAVTDEAADALMREAELDPKLQEIERREGGKRREFVNEEISVPKKKAKAKKSFVKIEAPVGGGPDVAGSRRGGFRVPMDRTLKKPPVNIYEEVFEGGKKKRYEVNQMKGTYMSRKPVFNIEGRQFDFSADLYRRTGNSRNREYRVSAFYAELNEFRRGRFISSEDVEYMAKNILGADDVKSDVFRKQNNFYYKELAQINIDKQKRESLLSGTGKRGTDVKATGKVGSKQFTKKTLKSTTKKISAEAMTGAGQKGIRKILSESIGAIPFLGDIIAMLVDIFVFGEPPGRAAFMAVGSALLGFLGGLLGSIAGPPGAIALGLLGGLGGDLLGGLLYDMMFGTPGSSNPLDRLPKTGFKQFIKKTAAAIGLSSGGFASYGKYMLGEQGREFVLDADSTASVEKNYPGLLMALNKADYDGALDVLKSRAFYEDGGTGTERMMPIPIPIPSPSNEYARSNSSIPSRRKSNLNHLTYSQLYRRG
tara:strand:+ start:877 stop:3030 length:2154 start_codon:yes stop_codon:yes gene_type:complete